jgi:hypothetical protein
MGVRARRVLRRKSSSELTVDDHPAADEKTCGEKQDCRFEVATNK